MKKCEECGAVIKDPYPTQKYCGPTCAERAHLKRDISFYQFPKETEEPMYEFDCGECGRHVEVYSRYDQRVKYCCGLCARKAKTRTERERVSKHRATNLGKSGAI